MSLFRSKLFWSCILFCVAIAGFFGVVVYQSRQPLEPVKIYKVVKPVPREKSTEKLLQTQTLTEDSTEKTSIPVDSYADVPIEDHTDLEEPEFDIEDVYELQPTVDDVNVTLEPSDTVTDQGLSAEEFAQEIQTRSMSIISRYPIASMSESEILEMSQTKEGLIEIKQQADGLQQEMNNLLFEYIPKLSEESKQQAKDEARQMLSGYMTPDQIEAHLSQYPW